MSTLRYAKPHVGRRVEKTVELGDELLALFLFKALAINKNKIVINKKKFPNLHMFDSLFSVYIQVDSSLKAINL